MPKPVEELITGYRARYLRLVEDQSSWRTHWLDIQEYMLPRSGRFLSSNSEKANDGKKKNDKIINGAAGDAIRTLAAGMQGGLTSPARPWFRLATPDEDLMEFAPVRLWLHQVRQLMLNAFARSNFYSSIHSIYTELGTFGTGAIIIEEDFRNIIRARPLTIGEYVMALSPAYVPDTLFRKFLMSSDQMVREYGYDNCSPAVQASYDGGTDKDKVQFEVLHVIGPNTDQDMAGPAVRRMPFVSLTFEFKGTTDKMLRERGYESIPFSAPRWDVTATDTYGNSPGMGALGDVKMLQEMEKTGIKALHKMVDPPMNAPSSLKAQGGGTIIPGGVNYYDVASGQQGFSPAYQVNPDLNGLEFKINAVETRIRRYFFNDLFLDLIQETKRMTAEEVMRRHDEKMLILGPVLERLESEMLNPIIDRAFHILMSLGILPPPPEELSGMDLNVDYISVLAQAQKMVTTSPIEQLAGFVGNIAAVFPEATDKFDADEAIDQYGDSVGVPPSVVRSDDMVAEIRAARAQQQQQMQQQEQMLAAAQGAKVLADTPLNTGSALDVLTQG